MLQEGGSVTTVGIYLRALRAVFNTAISDKSIQEEHYPFGKRKYEIPSAQNTKKAISLEEVRSIFRYQAVYGSSEHRAKDFWLLSYLCNGINVKDICLLKLKDLKGDHIEFVRAKTKRKTRSNQKTIRIYVTSQVRDIVDRWSTNNKKPDDYLFPIINDDMNAEKQHATIKEFTKSINKYIKSIAEQLGVEKHITTYTARHTFSTVLKRSGVSTEFIFEALGHVDKRTTENYLDSFENDTLKENAEPLL